MLLAISKTPNPTVFQKTLAVNDYYFGDEGFAFPMGHISFVGKLDAIALSAGAPPFVPGITLDVMARHSLDFWLTSEDLPDPSNRVTIDRDGTIVLRYEPNNVAGHKRLIARLEDLLQHLGADRHLLPRNLFVGQRIPLAGVAHQSGTIRFGDDRRTSALDRNCKAHDVDNLYVADASFFPSSGAVNPALTVMANALRVGDHLLERLNVRAADGAMLIEVARVAPPAPERPTEVQMVFYRVIDNTLVRQATPALPSFQRASADQFENVRLLNGIRSMDVRLWQTGVGWTPAGDTTIPAGAPPGTPAGIPGRLVSPGVEVILTRTDGRAFRRVFVVGA